MEDDPWTTDPAICCARCKLLLVPSPAGGGEHRGALDMIACPYCDADAEFLRREDAEAYLNDLAAHRRFRAVAAPLLADAAARRRAERAGLSPEQLLEDRRLRREEQGVAHEDAIRARHRAENPRPWPPPPPPPGGEGEGEKEEDDDDDDDGSSVSSLTSEDIAYELRRQREENEVEKWRERRRKLGVVEPRPTFNGTGGEVKQPAWELDLLPELPDPPHPPGLLRQRNPMTV